MPFDESDQAHINELAERVIKKQGPKDDKSDDEFLLHLYDALWENMRSKENRLWTFLSIYGAAVGLLFAGGQASEVPGAELFALTIIMALSVWAVLIVLNANWWYNRNQLIVTRIEKRFPEAVKGVVPKPYYLNPNFRYDALSQSSVLVLGLLLFLLYCRTLWTYQNPESIQSSLALFTVAVLYLLFVYSTGYCLVRHEIDIRRYYSAKKHLLEDAEELSSQERLNLLKDETSVRKKLDVRPWVLCVLFFVAALFDFIVYRNGTPSPWLWIGIICQVGVVVVFILQWIKYRQPYKQAEWDATKSLLDQGNGSNEINQKLQNMEGGLDTYQHNAWAWVLAVLVLLSACIPVIALVRTNQKIRDDLLHGRKPVSYGALAQQIDKLQQELQRIQDSYIELEKSNVELQQKLLDQRLAPYLTNEQAIKRFITREEFDRRVPAQPRATSKGGQRQ
jgi:cell division protein ZapA (FtsZ GTPase activity inhibitor)